MKRALLIFLILIIVISSASRVKSLEQKQVSPEGQEQTPTLEVSSKSTLNTIADLLSRILEKLNIIAEKDANVNVTVQPPIVNVYPNITASDSSSEMPKRGYVILAPQPNNLATYYDYYANFDQYLTLPNGECIVTVFERSASKDFVNSPSIVEEFNGASTRNLQECNTSICKKTVNIDDSYYMIKISNLENYQSFAVGYSCM